MDLIEIIAFAHQIFVFTHFLLCLITNNLISNVNAVGSSCQCVLFDDTYGKEYGVFTSPNWPTPYEDNIHCMLYTFQGKSDQIIEITFDEFDVQKTSLDCIYGDFVKLYLHLYDTQINEETTWNEVLCGKIADIEQTHYSADSSLIFEFHSDWRNGNNTGFRGTYRFLNKRLFQTDGELTPKTRCDYKFLSLTDIRQSSSSGSSSSGSGSGSSSSNSGSNSNSNSVGSSNINININNNGSTSFTGSLAGSGAAITGTLAAGFVQNTKGRFYSPQYPSTYPKGVRCSYQFLGQPLERVKLVFEHIRLQRSDISCLNSLDVIWVHDGKDKTSPVIGTLCNTNNFVELVSTSPNLFIDFVSKSYFPGQGFKGKFTFEPVSNHKGVDSPSTEPEKSEDKDKLQSSVTHSPVSNDCNHEFNSDTAKGGTFSSPNYPSPYPSNVHCIYHFRGRGKERVQILFTDFSVYKPDDTSRDCDGADVVMVFITINGQKERVDNLCGDDLPQQLMSNGPTITVEFKSTHAVEHQRGFQALYKFVTNFGITSGTQDPQSVCGFNFRSSERSNGSFTSPNYPGLYPRDTECHYFFYGNLSERVHITFAYFDVEGVTPCTTETASDYVEFSNYKTVDRKIPRHCGLKRPKTIESDGDFFRVTFKSNDRFDGTGFEAFYQFRSPDDSFTVKQVRGRSDGSSAQHQLPTLVPIIGLAMNLLAKFVFGPLDS